MAAEPWILACIGLLGACIGSFITLATYRLPLDETIGMTRSRCPKCEAVLGVRDLFPIFSWLAGGGRCRHCNTKVSFRYPLTEIACAASGVLAAMHYGLTFEAFCIAALGWGIVAIFVTDLEHQIILDEVQIILALVGIGYGIAMNIAPLDMAIASVIGVGIGLALKYGFLYLRHKDGLGLGDVKFLAVAGIWLADGANFVPFLFFSGLLGVASGIVWRIMGHGERFPFGPALAVALLFCVVMPESANQFWKLYGLLH